ncbi:MAG: type I DNA topoisomerase [Hyphomicrobiales bacterium]|nr:type I DNA topoisomerase [Hyphomicrobiales bacterium]
MHTVIVESPAKCRTLHKYLGKDYQVLASYGHIRDLPSKDGSVRPDEDFAMDYEISADSRKHVKAIADAVKKSDALILATDPDREGEAISWHVLQALQKQKALPKSLRIQRVTFSSITKRAVQDAMAAPRELDMDLVNAQQARRALDYLVGFNLSPVLWRKLPGSRSAGRVQSVALRLICDRESEIEAFVAQEYWDVTVDVSKISGEIFKARLTHLNGEKLDKFTLANEVLAQNAVATLTGKKLAVSSVEKKQVARHPAPPFTTSTLQQEAARKLGFSAKKTMQIAQQLYEGMDIGGETTGLITYMRTDGLDVAPEAIDAARRTIGKSFGDHYVPEKPRYYKSKAKNAQEAHEAIRPTDPARAPEWVTKYLNADQMKLYTLIWKRLIASQMASAALDQVTAVMDTEDRAATLRATGSTIKFDGFLKLYLEGRDDEEDEQEGVLPPLTEGEALTAEQITPEQHFTQPPPRYSEASLVKKLEELGIGRPSTYASILSILQDRGYVKLEKRRFTPEARGRIVTSFLASFFRRYVEYDFTAALEEQLDEISAGKVEWKAVLRQFWKDFYAAVQDAGQLQVGNILKQLESELDHLVFPGEGELEARRKCPSCVDGVLGLKLGKYGAFVGCSHYPECKYTSKLGMEMAEGETPETSVATNEPKMLGSDPATGEPISLRKGPYGFYVQLGEGKKPKRSSLPKGVSPEDVTLDVAIGLLTLPRNVGAHPETGEMITAGIGRYGPYIQHAKKYVSLRGGDDVLTIGINRAVALIAEAAEKAAKSGKKPAAKRTTRKATKKAAKN